MSFDAQDCVKSVTLHRMDNSNTIVCNLNLVTGFSVTGIAQCAPSTTFDPAIGTEIARDDAFNKLDELVAFMKADIEAGGPIAALLKPTTQTH